MLLANERQRLLKWNKVRTEGNWKVKSWQQCVYVSIRRQTHTYTCAATRTESKQGASRASQTVARHIQGRVACRLSGPHPSLLNVTPLGCVLIIMPFFTVFVNIYAWHDGFGDSAIESRRFCFGVCRDTLGFWGDVALPNLPEISHFGDILRPDKGLEILLSNEHKIKTQFISSCWIC